MMGITTIKKRMHNNPPHPGEVIRELCLVPLGLSVTAAAKALGVTRKTLSELLNGKSGVSPEMAIRLSIAFKTTPESWLSQQMQYDLWKARLKLKKLKVSTIAA
jgi:addiction module HigA family antidote